MPLENVSPLRMSTWKSTTPKYLMTMTFITNSWGNSSREKPMIQIPMPSDNSGCKSREWDQKWRERSTQKRAKGERRGKGTTLLSFLSSSPPTVFFLSDCRFDIHSKLVNFMAPVYCESQMTDEAREELFKSLFGNPSKLKHDAKILHR